MGNTRSTAQPQHGLAPPLSVVMPVHNALPHLDQAVRSILDQSFGDFEFIILDDASTDGSGERLREWAKQDPRIRLLHVDRNLGPVRSSNMVAEAARAEIVARMDADDVSYPDRLREQMKVLQDNPDAGVVGSLADMIDAKGKILRLPDAWRISRRSPFVPFAHGAMMYRRALFERLGGYREECAYWEDQDLVVRMAAAAKVLVIPHSLYQIRAWASSTRIASDPARIEEALNRMYAATDRLGRSGEYEVSKMQSPDAKVDARAFVAMGSVRLWAGERPRLFLRVIKRGKLSFNVMSLSALVWAAWASVSPGTLQAFLKLLLASRNRATSLSKDGEAAEWRPFLQESRSPEPQSELQKHRSAA